MNKLYKRRLFTKLVPVALGVSLLSMPSTAEDTEIYFGTTSADPNASILPNVLFVLDTSSSMNQIVAGTGKSRLDNMKDALKNVLGTMNNVNVGLMRFSNPGGPVLFPMANINADAADVEGTSNAASVTIPISEANDDAEQSEGTGNVDLNSLDLDLEQSFDPQLVGVRFQNVGVPQGVTITNAVIQFTADGNDSDDDADAVIAAEDADTAAPWGNSSGTKLTDRVLTTAAVTWEMPEFVTGDVYASADISSVVQEVVNRSGWCGGNNMAFVIDTVDDERDAVSYEQAPGSAPVLHIEWDPASVPAGGGCIKQTLSAQVQTSTDDAEERGNGNMNLTSSDLELVRDSGLQTVGVRFRNIDIPQNATILDAELEFEVDEANNTNAVSVQIHGQDPSEPETVFTSAKNNITGRLKTASSVAWPTLPTPPVNSKLVSPDISVVVQEMVNDTDWVADEDMVFILSDAGGNGKRTMEAYDGEPAAAPVLRVTYQAQVTATSGGAVKTVRQRLTEIIDELQYKSGTPIVDVAYEAALYYRGEAVDYGKQRGGISTSRREFTRVSHPASYTSGNVIRQAACTDNNLNAVACRDEEIDLSPVYQSPLKEDCQANYIVLLSDGTPTVNTSVSKVEAMIGTSCAGSGNGKCSTEIVDFLRNQDQSSTLPDDQTIKTFTIGFNLVGDPQYLKDMATVGGGQFFSASTATQLANVFQNIFAEILEVPSSFSAPSLSVNAFNKLFNRDTVYFALFEPSETQAWEGNIKKFRICTDPATQNGCVIGDVIDADEVPAIGADFKIKGDARSIWSTTADGPEVTEGGAGSQVPAAASRTVLTYTGSDDSPNSPIALTVGSAHEFIKSNASVTKTLLGDPAMTDARRDNIMDWGRGQDIDDEDGDSDTTENRWAFSDPLHSRPVTVTFGGTEANPIIKIFVGTNDGGIRMINDATGEEEWILYPPEILDRLAALRADGAGDKIYGVDSTPEVFTVDVDGDGIIEPADGDKVQIFIGMRRGGKNIYAFDVTPASTLTTTTSGQITPKFMWRIIGGTGDFVRLGQTWSQPMLANIRSGNASGTGSEQRTVLIFGGGYDEVYDNEFAPASPTNIGNALYMVDTDDGSLIWWASNVGSGASLELPGMDFPIPSDLALLDSNGDFEIDRLYAVDVGGQVWRLDLDANLKLNNNGATAGARLAAIATAGGTPPIDERRFFFSVDVAEVRDEFFSVEKDYDVVTIGSGYRAHPNDLDVQDRLYLFRDYMIDDLVTVDASGVSTNYPLCNNTANPTDPPLLQVCLDGSSNVRPLDESDLQDVTANLIQDGDASQVAAEQEALRISNGWYIVLKENDGSFVGEKVLAKSIIIDGTVFYTTFTPAIVNPTNPCAANEGAGTLYAVDLLNGGAEFDFNNNTTLEKADRTFNVGGGI
ncbi:MAG: PilC/PilY family type IV pilus protein, partial [Gammaproteobacteria bacterium]|nr:PilC/PilY family type IV pilus protein [Gammaproteobacteria bacterium]